jgi:hypothetical protein
MKPSDTQQRQAMNLIIVLMALSIGAGLANFIALPGLLGVNLAHFDIRTPAYPLEIPRPIQTEQTQTLLLLSLAMLLPLYLLPPLIQRFLKDLLLAEEAFNWPRLLDYVTSMGLITGLGVVTTGLYLQFYARQDPELYRLILRQQALWVSLQQLSNFGALGIIALGIWQRQVMPRFFALWGLAVVLVGLSLTLAGFDPRTNTLIRYVVPPILGAVYAISLVAYLLMALNSRRLSAKA